MATASRRARKISRHSHWPTATRPAVRGEGPPRPGHHHRGRPPVPGSLTNTARRPRRYGPPRRGPAPPGRPRRSRRRPDPHAQPGTARHAQRRQPAIGRTAVPAARGHAVPHPRRAVLTPGGRLRQRPLAARKRGNPRPHPETERSVRGPAAPTTQVCKNPFGGGTPAKLDGSPAWSRFAIGRRRRGAHSRLYVCRLLAAGPRDGIPDRGVLLLVVDARVRGACRLVRPRVPGGSVTAGSGRLRGYGGRWCVSGRVRRGGRSWRSRFIWAVSRRARRDDLRASGCVQRHRGRFPAHSASALGSADGSGGVRAERVAACGSRAGAGARLGVTRCAARQARRRSHSCRRPRAPAGQQRRPTWRAGSPGLG